ncbi:MAG: DUF3604 domain-containing protein [Haliea sp.]|jgi:hypothetical protein|nr:DUF3604 domain-containing protein [Haliea sp.]
MKKLMTLACLLCFTAGNAVQAKQLLWGDTHLHTNNSMDAFTVGNLTADPATAYRYAMGMPVIHPYHRARVQIETPLDFLVVSDHAEYLGVIRHIYHEGVPGDDLGIIERAQAMVATWILRWGIDSGGGLELFGDELPPPEDPPEAASRMLSGEEDLDITWIPPLPQVESATWREATMAADAHNRPGEFSAFIGWEWSSIPGGANLHRIVITDSDAATAQQYQPFSFVNSPFPEDLWAWLDNVSEKTGADFISIPHNSNISKGYMFDTETLRGKPLTADYVATRMKWEKVAEVTQIKGDSETHPDLSPEDPFADFESYPYYIQRDPTPYVAGEGDYIRPALKRGLAIERELGQNPYQFGLIGSTDAHTAMASAEEDNFHGKLAQDSIPENKSGGAIRGSVTGWSMSASGLAAVWAKENTRESILAAMKRREVYATSGPRIAVQFFAGPLISEELLQAADVYGAASAAGVPMGGEFSSRTGQAPAFLVRAMKDPVGANLDRVQIVKGWIDGGGQLHEQVFDVAWSGDRIPDSDGRLPPVGDTVDRASATYSNDIGAAELSTVWRDPQFDPSQPAFYYTRVLQIPTPRHSLYDAIALGKDGADDHPDTIQERAYTSPVWYRPSGN